MKIFRVVPVVALLASLAVPATAPAETLSVVASRINNPRQVTLGPGGELYVASAGRGGSRCQGKGEDRQCFGFTSRVLKLEGGERGVVAGGFLSLAGPDGSFAVGVDGVGVRPDGTVFAVETSATPDELRGLPRRVRRQTGKLYNVTSGERRPRGRHQRLRVRAQRRRGQGRSQLEPLRRPRPARPDDRGRRRRQRDPRRAQRAREPARRDPQERSRTSRCRPRSRSDPTATSTSASWPSARASGRRASGGSPPPVDRPLRWRPASPRSPGWPSGLTAACSSPSCSATRGRRRSVATSCASRPTGRGRRSGVGKLIAPAGAAVDAQGRVYVSNLSVAPARTPRASPFRGAGGQVVRITP